MKPKRPYFTSTYIRVYINPYSRGWSSADTFWSPRRWLHFPVGSTSNYSTSLEDQTDKQIDRQADSQGNKKLVSEFSRKIVFNESAQFQIGAKVYTSRI